MDFVKNKDNFLVLEMAKEALLKKFSKKVSKLGCEWDLAVKGEGYNFYLLVRIFSQETYFSDKTKKNLESFIPKRFEYRGYDIPLNISYLVKKEN